MNGVAPLKEGNRDHKPIITCAGELEVFTSLEDSLNFSLPQESCEWRRSLGRPVRNVHVGVRFSPFSPEALPRESQWDLIRHPLFHIYWTDCSDVELYKKNVHDDVESWLRELNARNISDWLVVVVETFDMKRSNKLLPRTTVLDKIRADFAPKQGDRCISVLNPGRQENRTADSWRGLVARVRYLVLVAYAKAVGRLEEHVRSQRERRNEPGWHFMKYFELQEELAEVLEMLGLYDESLVQYDELDALFSQFVVNAHAGDAAPWLSEFQEPLERWHGLRLGAHEMPLRPSLLELRAYMFAKQAHLLLLSCKPWEMASRCLPFLHTCVRELSLLEVPAPNGAVSCWLFLACLEVLQTCDKFNDAGQIEAYSRHTAGLWAYAGEKVRELGELCGLTGGGDDPTSEQLHTVVSLSAGMGDCAGAPGRPSPTDRLKEALCSQEAFNKLYLELSELAVGTYKHIGRLRSARLVGRDLASFFRQLGQQQQAAAFLNDALKTFEQEGWRDLAAQGQRELAACHLQAGDKRKYARACAAVAAAPETDTVVRCAYFDELLKCLPAFDRPLSLPFAGAFRLAVVSLRCDHVVTRDSEVTAVLELESGFPRELLCSKVAVSVEQEKSLAAGPSPSPAKERDRERERERTSLVTNVVHASAWRDAKPREPALAVLSIRRRLEYRQDKQIASANVVCKSALPLRRTDSGVKVPRGDFTDSLRPEKMPVLLTPGLNSLNVSWPATRPGRYVIGQVLVESGPGPIELVSPPLTPRLRFEVRTRHSTVRLDNESPELLAGMEQRLLLTVAIGCDAANEGDTLVLRCTRGLMLRPDRPNADYVPDLRVPLESVAPFSTFRVRLRALADLPAREHVVNIQCPWTTDLLTVPLGFTAPLAATWRLNTASARKFLQVVVTGRTTRTLRLSNADLWTDSPVLFKDLNPVLDGRASLLATGATLSFMWELKPGDDSRSFPGKADFTVEYVPVPSGGEHESDDSTVTPRLFKHAIELSDYDTLYSLEARVEPSKGSEFCRVGALCHLRLTVKNSTTIADTDTDADADSDADTTTTTVNSERSRSLMYEVLAEQSVWAVCGRTAGVISMEEGSGPQHVTLDVMPLVSGFLPLPLVRLSKYIPADKVDHPRLEPFSPGQIYNASKGRQVHVLPPANELA